MFGEDTKQGQPNKQNILTMRKIILVMILAGLFTTLVFSQTTFSDETKKYIDYNDSITVFKNALLINGKGNAAKPGQTIIISNGKIKWIGDDALVIDGNPSKNISDIRKVQYVFKNGVGYNSKKLFESVKGKVAFN